MKLTTKLDKTNRVVITKQMRDALGAKPGQTLVIEASNGMIIITARHVPARVVKRGKLKVIDCQLPDVGVAEAVAAARHYYR